MKTSLSLIFHIGRLHIEHAQAQPSPVRCTTDCAKANLTVSLIILTAVPEMSFSYLCNFNIQREAGIYVILKLRVWAASEGFMA